MTATADDGHATDPPAGPRILIVSPDLLSTSRIAGLARDAGGIALTLRSPADVPPEGPYDLVLVDLQGLVGDPAAIVTRVRALVAGRRSRTGQATRVVAFGPHVAKDRLERAAAAGADAAVSRGELLGAFPTVVSRWCH